MPKPIRNSLAVEREEKSDDRLMVNRVADYERQLTGKRRPPYERFACG